jgi:putative membrane protein
MHKLFLALAVAAGVGLAAAPAADDKRPTGADKDQKALTPQEFVFKVAGAGQFEVRASQFALAQAGSDKVKQFARQMIQDHTRANQELAALAARKGWPVPPGVAPKHIDLLQQLGRQTGSNFDRQYAEIQVKAHEEAVALFEAQAAGGQDADLKQWTGKTLPTLKEHLKMARDLTAGGAGGRGDDRNKPGGTDKPKDR